MFTKQMADALSQMNLDPATKQALLQSLGNCSQSLAHRGDITVDTSTPNAPTINVWAPDEGPTNANVTATFKPTNYTSTMDTDLTQVFGGFTNFAFGVSWFQYLLFDHFIKFGFEGTELDVVTDITVNLQSCTISVQKETIYVLKKKQVTVAPQQNNNPTPGHYPDPNVPNGSDSHYHYQHTI